MLIHDGRHLYQLRPFARRDPRLRGIEQVHLFDSHLLRPTEPAIIPLGDGHGLERPESAAFDDLEPLFERFDSLPQTDVMHPCIPSRLSRSRSAVTLNPRVPMALTGSSPADPLRARP